MLLVRIFCLVILCSLSVSVQAQFFVADGTPCPSGNSVQADTIFFTPDKAMPFDRCFYLKHTVPGNVQIKFFAIYPIDKYGKLNIRKRDYRVFLKSGWPNKEKRREVKKSIPFDTFQVKKVNRLFTGIIHTTKGKNTEVTLRIPPLDPNREYQIILINEDPKSSNELYAVGELIFKSRLDDNDNAKKNIAKAKREHSRNRSIRNNREIPFSYTRIDNNRTENFAEFEEYLASFNLEFNRDVDKKVKEYRIFFVPNDNISTLNDDQILSLDYTHYLKDTSKSDPEKIFFNRIIRDEKGRQLSRLKDIHNNEVVRFTDKTYQIKLLSIYSFEKNQENILVPNKYTFSELGNWKIDKNGTEYSFIVNEDILDGEYIKITSVPINKYRLIQDGLKSIDELSKTDYGPYNLDALSYLMNQALIFPGVEKGIKDLALKDSLTRTISIFFEQSKDVIKNINLGIVSLIDPNSLIEINQHLKRKTNIQSSIKQLNSLIEFCNEVKTYKNTNKPDLNLLLQNLYKFKSNLKTIEETFDSIIKSKAELESMYTQEFSLFQTVPASLGSTTTLDFVSESKFRIVPDFGFIALFNANISLKLKPKDFSLKFNDFSFQDFTPYLGFHINFRSIDKNISIQNVKYKTWRHRLSFMSGITLKPLKIEKQREDFFVNSSLITGLGYRIDNRFRVTFGTVWFKALDTNPLTNKKPLRLLPFVGLSLDLDLRDLFGGINTLFKL